MALLKDKNEEGTWVEFTFKYHIPGEREGCQLNFKYFKTNRKVYDLDFGWTNITLKNYIEATSQFPVESLNGFYSSFEKDLYELSWEELDSGTLYQLNFYGSQQDFCLFATKEAIRQFGADLKTDWDLAPLH
ncbi:hypothetical protein C1I59_15725 [Paenibacillus polymyxa]|uniref:hypothetical protein n=1 Tax=Paenibacillus polymyxa TaxID=1406 RepID=UPI0010BE8FC9|nr:hypothetical protein [Paenibacillus polymyxa]TKH35343.1 hypothetical protein C1I59_15725 [Paenibacillus polymyxa]